MSYEMTNLRLDFGAQTTTAHPTSYKLQTTSLFLSAFSLGLSARNYKPQAKIHKLVRRQPLRTLRPGFFGGAG
jgi:hypothetical protein